MITVRNFISSVTYTYIAIASYVYSYLTDLMSVSHIYRASYIAEGVWYTDRYHIKE